MMKKNLGLILTMRRSCLPAPKYFHRFFILMISLPLFYIKRGCLFFETASLLYTIYFV
jgi:hypothetical protein